VQTEFTEKGMGILKETVPQATRFGVVWTPTAPSGRLTLQAAEAAGRKLGVQVEGVSVLSVADFDGAFCDDGARSRRRRSHPRVRANRSS